MEDGEQGPDADRPPGRRRRFTREDHGHTEPTRLKSWHHPDKRRKDWKHAIPFKPAPRPILPLDDQAKLAARMEQGKRHAWISEEEWSWILSWRRAKVCQAKQPFESREAAIREGLVRKAKPGTPMLSAYRCETCGKFHLTKRR